MAVKKKQLNIKLQRNNTKKLTKKRNKCEPEKESSLKDSYRRWCNFLYRWKSHDNAKTHVSQVKPKMSLNISIRVMDEFYKEYRLARKAGITTGIAEIQHSYMPLIIDFDWRFEEAYGEKRKYNLKHIKLLIECIKDSVMNLYSEVSKEALTCLILEKGDVMRLQEGETKKVYKDGWHLHFPFCKINNMQQRSELRKEVINLIYTRKIFEDLDNKSLNTIENAYDSNVPNVTWLLYGSRKVSDNHSWVVTHCLDHKGNSITAQDVFGVDFKREDMVKKLSVNIPDIVPLNLKKEYTYEDIIVIQPKIKLDSKDIKMLKPTLKEVDQLLKIIKPERWSEYQSWIELGICIYNVAKGSTGGLELWRKYSQTSDKYKEGECEKIWESSLYEGTKGMGTIKWIAKQDDEKRYLRLHNKRRDNSFYNMLSLDTYDIAKFIKGQYEGRFVCVNIKSDKWYEFINHKWKTSDSGVGLEMLLPEEIVHLIRQKMNVFMGNEKEKEDELTKIHGQSLAVIKKLKNVNHRSLIMKELRRMFYDPDFYQRLDTNKDLFCFTNGVYDLKNIYFREGRPTDYISLCCNIAYDNTIDWGDNQVKFLKNYLNQVFPNINNRKFFMRWAASCLKGGNIDKLFIVWIGPGDGGKSTTSELLEACFDEYMIKFPIDTLIGGYAKSNSTNSDIAQMHGKRIGGFQEPPQHSFMNISKIKDLSGGDSTYTREVFEKGRKTRPDVKLFLQCNHAPKAPSYDKAYYNRLRLLPFESCFTDEAPTNKSDQWKEKKFPKNRNFRSFLPSLAPAFMWMLIEEFKSYDKDGLLAPNEVIKATDEYRFSNDAMYQYISQTLIEMEEPEENTNKSGITIKDIYSSYKLWFREMFPGTRIQDISEIKEDLELRWGRPLNYKGNFKWNNWRWRTDDDDDEGKEIDDMKSRDTKDSYLMHMEDDDLSIYTNNGEEDEIPFDRVKDDDDFFDSDEEYDDEFIEGKSPQSVIHNILLDEDDENVEFDGLYDD